ncbi:MAG: hypothetical protein EPO06_11995 [Burkholderiaceae bacterium]|nr:MAG: hypothetical protein EPO06_11995 [Burkholderiaceae bacterium]
MLPPFPVDPATIDLLDAAVRPPEGSERSSLCELLGMYADMSGATSDDPDVTYHYHHNDVIAALIDEVRRLRQPS